MSRRAALATVALSLAACGGGGALTRAEYVTQGNAICVKAQRELDALAERDLPPAEEGPKAAKIGDRQVDDLLDLEPPESLSPQAARLEELVEEVRDLGQKAAQDDGDASSRALETVKAKGEEADRVLTELGLDRCANAA